MQYYTILRAISNNSPMQYFFLYLFEFKNLTTIYEIYTLFFVEDCFELTMIHFS
jgi:hypothetical protein